MEWINSQPKIPIGLKYSDSETYIEFDAFPKEKCRRKEKKSRAEEDCRLLREAAWNGISANELRQLVIDLKPKRAGAKRSADKSSQPKKRQSTVDDIDEVGHLILVRGQRQVQERRTAQRP